MLKKVTRNGVRRHDIIESRSERRVDSIRRQNTHSVERMSEATIPFASPELFPALFGAQDRYLRLIRDALGIDLTYRGDELRLKGSEEQIKRAQDVLEELQAIVERRGFVEEHQVRQILEGKGPAPANGQPPAPVVVSEAINLFEKARKVTPRTAGQADYVQAIRENDLVFCEGPAGCGKTYLAVAMALNALRQEQVRKIVLVRPAVEAGEKLGFLPGDLLAKVNPFLRPLLDALADMIEYEQVKRYMERDVIEIVPLAFMRGRTLNGTFIILDEGQNTTVTQMKMFLTRMGQGSRIVVTGDTTQSDLPPNVPSGMVDAIHRLEHLEGVGTVHLTGKDIVRHRLVREIVQAYDREQPPRPRHRK